MQNNQNTPEAINRQRAKIIFIVLSCLLLLCMVGTAITAIISKGIIDRQQKQIKAKDSLINALPSR